MVWPMGHATGGDGPETDSFTLTDKLQRVSEADVASVTREDVERLKSRVNNDMLRAAMETMLAENKFCGVLAQSSPAAWDAASRHIRPTQAQVFTSLVKDRMILLFNVLPHLPEDFLTMMEDSLTPF